MPRRNNRPTTFEPLDLTPADVKRGIPRPKGSRRDVLAERRRIEEEQADQQREARINGGINWNTCLVPGCGRPSRFTSLHAIADRRRRDHSAELPLCIDHSAVAYRQAAHFEDEVVVEAVARVVERRRARADAEEAEKETRRRDELAKTDGHIYYVRLNGLIKAGWTRSLEDRLRNYGPDVEVLCHYPGTRTDETYLHRQLRPFLARGREWYQDCKALHDFVNQALEEHGSPHVVPRWTQPKEVVRPRRRSA
jgi:hypothetical protein